MSPTPIGIFAASGAPLPLEWIGSGLGSGYGSALVSMDGSTYIQTYPRTIKLNKFGKTVWAYEFSGSGNKQGMAIDADENVYIAGNGSLVASFTKDGDLRWQRLVGDSIDWNSVAVDSVNGFVYVVGKIGTTTGHIAKLNSSTGLAVWRRGTSPMVEFQGVSVSSDGAKIAATGYVSNGTSLDTHFVEINSSGSVIFQRRLSLGTSNFVLSQSTAYSSSNVPVVSGYMTTPRVNFVTGFEANGSTSFSIRASDSGFISSDFGTVGYDPSGFMYLGFYNLINNFGPGQFGEWGTGYTRFSGSTPQKTVTFLGATGTLRLSTSKVDRGLVLMGITHVVKVLGDDSAPTGPHGSFTIYEDPQGLSYISSGISHSADSVSYSDFGTTTTAASFSVVPVTANATLTYIK